MELLYQSTAGRLPRRGSIVKLMQGDYGISVRMAKVLPSRFTLAAVLDDGFFSGPGGRLVGTSQYVRELLALGVNVFMAYPGVIHHHIPAEASCARIVNLSVAAVTAMPDERRVAISAESAVRLGADAVTLHVVIGHPSEAQSLKELAKTVEIAHSYSMPVLAVMYGAEVQTSDSPSLLHLGRIAHELDVDLIKVRHTGLQGELEDLVDSVRPTPVLVAGGPASTDRDAIKKAQTAYRAGAAGLCFGRSLAYASDLQGLITTLRKLGEEE